MYWKNPLIKVVYPSDQDPIQASFHNGVHCLFYDPAVPKQQIRYKQTLQDICNWANSGIQQHGIQGFAGNQSNHYDIANIVKLNMWIDDIRKQGIVKPMLLVYDGQDQYGINNGESRLRALERIPAIATMNSFISTRQEHADRFAHLTPVTDFEQFAQLCGATPGQQFLFTLTDPDAQYGIYWYEFNSDRTRAVTPGEETCVATFENYFIQHTDTVFTVEWFDTLVDWCNYGLTF
jgi:hypothetical protein